jgi:BlaI family penicillinase repressor
MSPRSQAPTISDAEWQVMSVIWDQPPGAAPLIAQDFIQALASRHDWSPRTVKTMLGRLVKKGALKTTAEGNRYLYRAAVTRDRCVRAESRSFLKRVFNNDPAHALMHFVEDTDLSAEQIQSLRKLLKEKENG